MLNASVLCATAVVSTLLFVQASAATSLTSAEQTAILDRHHSLRANVGSHANQPCTAADMEMLVWDDTLATQAQSYADGCVGDHATGAGSSFGENLWLQFPGASYTQAEMIAGVQSWYDEVVDTVWNIGDSGPKSKCLSSSCTSTCASAEASNCNVGHYFQVIWAKSNKIGCGIKTCSSLSSSGSSLGSGVLLVCRYTPAASLGAGVTNSPPYLFGHKCADCAGQCSTSPAGLCTAAPGRCVDKTGWSITISQTFTNCADIINAYPAGHSQSWCSVLAPLMSATDNCALSCGTCTAAPNTGSSFCGSGGGTTAGPGGATTTGAPGGTGGTTAGPGTGAPGATTTTITSGASSSSSTSASTGTGTTAAQTVAGTLKLTMSDASSFSTHANAAKALREALADILAGITADMITITSIAVALTRRLDIDEHVIVAGDDLSSRRLAAGAVDVAYNINVPAGITAPTKDSLDASKTSFQTQLNTRMASNGVTASDGTAMTTTGVVVGEVSPLKATASGCFQQHVVLPILVTILALLF